MSVRVRWRQRFTLPCRGNREPPGKTEDEDELEDVIVSYDERTFSRSRVEVRY